MSFGRYAVIVSGIVGGSLAAVWPLLPSGDGSRGAAVCGGVLAALNTLFAYALVLWSSRRSTGVFMGAVLGGMIGRMGLMLAAVVAAVLGLDMPKVPLAVSLLSYFVLFLVFELAVLHKRPTTTAAVAR